jgi:hypothetical protein
VAMMGRTMVAVAGMVMTCRSCDFGGSRLHSQGRRGSGLGEHRQDEQRGQENPKPAARPRHASFNPSALSPPHAAFGRFRQIRSSHPTRGGASRLDIDQPDTAVSEDPLQAARSRIRSANGHLTSAACADPRPSHDQALHMGAADTLFHMIVDKDLV